jgi:hypothetical protein
MFTIEETRRIGNLIGVDWDKIDIKQFQRGLLVELEHGSKYGQATNVTKDDPILTGRIAYAHLLEFPDYYSRLGEMELEAENFWEAKGA